MLVCVSVFSEGLLVSTGESAADAALAQLTPGVEYLGKWMLVTIWPPFLDAYFDGF